MQGQPNNVDRSKIVSKTEKRNQKEHWYQGPDWNMHSLEVSTETTENSQEYHFRCSSDDHGSPRLSPAETAHVLVQEMLGPAEDPVGHWGLPEVEEAAVQRQGSATDSTVGDQGKTVQNNDDLIDNQLTAEAASDGANRIKIRIGPEFERSKSSEVTAKLGVSSDVPRRSRGSSISKIPIQLKIINDGIPYKVFKYKFNKSNEEISEKVEKSFTSSPTVEMMLPDVVTIPDKLLNKPKEETVKVHRNIDNTISFKSEQEISGKFEERKNLSCRAKIINRYKEARDSENGLKDQKMFESKMSDETDGILESMNITNENLNDSGFCSDNATNSEHVTGINTSPGHVKRKVTMFEKGHLMPKKDGEIILRRIRNRAFNKWNFPSRNKTNNEQISATEDLNENVSKSDCKIFSRNVPISLDLDFPERCKTYCQIETRSRSNLSGDSDDAEIQVLLDESVTDETGFNNNYLPWKKVSARTLQQDPILTSEWLGRKTDFVDKRLEDVKKEKNRRSFCSKSHTKSHSKISPYDHCENSVTESELRRLGSNNAKEEHGLGNTECSSDLNFMERLNIYRNRYPAEKRQELATNHGEHSKDTNNNINTDSKGIERTKEESVNFANHSKSSCSKKNPPSELEKRPVEKPEADMGCLKNESFNNNITLSDREDKIRKAVVEHNFPSHRTVLKMSEEDMKAYEKEMRSYEKMFSELNDEMDAKFREKSFQTSVEAKKSPYASNYLEMDCRHSPLNHEPAVAKNLCFCDSTTMSDIDEKIRRRYKVIDQLMSSNQGKTSKMSTEVAKSSSCIGDTTLRDRNQEFSSSVYKVLNDDAKSRDIVEQNNRSLLYKFREQVSSNQERTLKTSGKHMKSNCNKKIDGTKSKFDDRNLPLHVEEKEKPRDLNPFDCSEKQRFLAKAYRLFPANHESKIAKGPQANFLEKLSKNRLRYRGDTEPLDSPIVKTIPKRCVSKSSHNSDDSTLVTRNKRMKSSSGSSRSSSEGSPADNEKGVQEREVLDTPSPAVSSSDESCAAKWHEDKKASESGDASGQMKKHLFLDAADGCCASDAPITIKITRHRAKCRKNGKFGNDGKLSRFSKRVSFPEKAKSIGKDTTKLEPVDDGLISDTAKVHVQINDEFRLQSVEKQKGDLVVSFGPDSKGKAERERSHQEQVESDWGSSNEAASRENELNGDETNKSDEVAESSSQDRVHLPEHRGQSKIARDPCRSASDLFCRNSNVVEYSQRVVHQVGSEGSDDNIRNEKSSNTGSSAVRVRPIHALCLLLFLTCFFFRLEMRNFF